MDSKASIAASWQWLVLIWLSAALVCWVRLAAGHWSLSAAACIFSVVVTCWGIGDIFLRCVLQDGTQFNNFSTRLVAGTLLGGVFLYVAALILPFGLVFDWAMITLVVAVIWLCIRGRRLNTLKSNVHVSEAIFLLVAPALVAIWCRELLQPMEFSDSSAILRVWPDIYYHLCQISAIANSKGMGTLSDVQMAGVSVYPYHLASYVLPALFVDATGDSALVAYAGILVPLGLLLAAIAAYSVAASIFGRWPALAAGLSVLLLPDAFQQGFGNPFLSSYWLQQIAPAGSYGVASAAVVFMLILEACKSNKYRLACFGYAFVLVTLVYKAQIFVAISFLALILPAVFMGKLAVRFRIYLISMLVFLYFSIITVLQLNPSVPVMRLDGSGLAMYSSAVMSNQADGYLRSIFGPPVTDPNYTWSFKAGVFAMLLTLGTFGVFPFWYAALAGYLRKAYHSTIWLLPLCTLAIYLLMATCLALDSKRVGAAEELLHRPFVWAYFLLVVWSAAAGYRKLFGDALPSSIGAKYLLVLVIIFALIVPIKFGRSIQTFRNWKIGYQELPICQLRAAQFIRANSAVDDVVQDSMNDHRFVLSALSERRPFAINSGGVRAPKGILPRLVSLRDLRSVSTADQVESFMKEQAIKWYVSRDGDGVQWKDSLTSRMAFQCGEYRVYRF